MSNTLPTKMSQFENTNSLGSGSFLVGLGLNGSGQTINVKISEASASYHLGKNRWILPGVTSSADTRGDHGAESFDLIGNYWIKSGSTWIVNSTTSTSASYAETASVSGYSISSSYASSTKSASYAISASYTSTTTSASYSISSSFALTTSNATSASYSRTSSYTSTTISASYSSTSSYSLTTTSASYSVSASFASTTPTATSASYSLSSSYSLTTSNATSASYSSTSSYALTSIAKTGSLYSRLVKNTASSLTNPVTQTSWVKADTFNVRDYGAVGNGTTDDTSAILAAVSASVMAGGGTVYFPDGIYSISSSVIVPSNPQCDIALVGNGSNVSIIKQNGSANGIYFNMDNGGTGDQIYQVLIDKIGLWANTTTQTAIAVTYGITSVSAHQNPSVTINDVHILSDGSNYWSNGIVLESAWNFRINKAMVVGNTAAYTGSALEIKRMCVNGTIHQSQFNFWDTGIYVNTTDYSSAGQNTEGLLMDQLFMVPVRRGIYAAGNGGFTAIAGLDWANRPVAGRIALLTLTNSHIDSRNSGDPVSLNNVEGHYITNNFLICDGSGSLVRYNNAYEGNLIGNTLYNAGSGPSVYVGGFTGSANIMTANILRGGSTHFYLESSSMYNKVYGNTGANFLTPTVVDSGTSNLVGSSGT